MPADGRKCLLVFAYATHMMLAGNRPANTTLGRHVERISVAATTAFLSATLAPQPQPIQLGIEDELAPTDSLACK